MSPTETLETIQSLIDELSKITTSLVALEDATPAFDGGPVKMMPLAALDLLNRRTVIALEVTQKLSGSYYAGWRKGS